MFGLQAALSCSLISMFNRKSSGSPRVNRCHKLRELGDTRRVLRCPGRGVWTRFISAEIVGIATFMGDSSENQHRLSLKKPDKTDIKTHSKLLPPPTLRGKEARNTGGSKSPGRHNAIYARSHPVRTKNTLCLTQRAFCVTC